MKDYSMYRYYKGEEENPFSKILNAFEVDKSHLPPPECMKIEHTMDAEVSKKLGIASHFWYYEKHFELNFSKNESSDWFSYFEESNPIVAKKFMDLLSVGDYNRPSESKKSDIFNIWLKDCFFLEKYPDYGNPDDYKKEYYSTSARELQDQYTTFFNSVVCQGVGCEKCRFIEKYIRSF